MKYKEIKGYKKWNIGVLFLILTCFMVGCGDSYELPVTTGMPITTESSAEEYSSSEQSSLPEGTEGESQTGESVSEPEPTTQNPEETVSATLPEDSGAPTESQVPFDPVAEGYPALKADGRGWGLSYRDSGLQPWGNEVPKTLAAYDAYYVGSANENVIYLTFDCGYENGNTDPILTTLKNHDVKATFFVTGHFLETEQELTKRMVEEGHAVGNHTYNHPDITTLDETKFREELDSIQKKFHEVTGAELSMYFRPPEGKCYSQTLKWSQDMGYATILWSLAHVDWYTDNQPKPEDAIATLTKRTHPGAIVLLHNTSKTNAEILDQLITKWKEMGYTIRPLSDLVGW